MTFAIGYAHTGTVREEFARSLAELTWAFHGTVFGMIPEGGYNVFHNRNEVTRRFLDETTADALLFIDTDMGVKAEAVQRIFRTAERRTDADIVAGCYLDNNGALTAGMENVAEGGIDTLGGEIAIGPDKDVDGAGTGLMLIKRGILDRMRRDPDKQARPPYWWFDADLDFKLMKRRSDDYSFCLRAKRIGGKVVLCTSAWGTHYKVRGLMPNFEWTKKP